jgi:integrase/recombinase XerD
MAKPNNHALLEAYLQDAELQGLMPETCLAYRGNINTFLEFLGRRSALDVTVVDLKAFLAKQKAMKLSASTLRVQFSAISSLYDFLVYEEKVKGNPVPGFRKRYLKTIRRQAAKDQSNRRQLLSVEDMRRLVHSIADVRDRAFLVLLAKTGARREEITELDTSDVDWTQLGVTFKPHPKRTNLQGFFDHEAARVLRRWLAIRKARGAPDQGPLFVGDRGGRLDSQIACDAITEAAQRLGLHDPKGPLHKRFTPHCCRHWYTTHLRRADMKREYVAWLRGDAPRGTLDIYLHIDAADVRESYLARIPQLGL